MLLAAAGDNPRSVGLALLIVVLVVALFATLGGKK